MGLKENFMQAVKELLGASTPQLVTEPNIPVDAERGSAAGQRIKAANPFSRREEYFPADEPFSVPEPAPATSVAPPVFHDSVSPSPLTTPQKEGTVIAAGTVVQGAIRAAGSLELYGEVYGDVATKENLKLCGRLEGNAAGQDIEVNNGRIKGDIIATGRVSINNNSIVLGNIKAETLVLNGKVKGNLDIKGSLSLDINAAVAGSVVSGKLSIAEGAILQGDVRISSTDLNKLFAEGEAAGKRAEAVKPPEAPAPAAPRKPLIPPVEEAPADKGSEL